MWLLYLAAIASGLYLYNKSEQKRRKRLQDEWDELFGKDEEQNGR